jgi:hypothetical protein
MKKKNDSCEQAKQKADAEAMKALQAKAAGKGPLVTGGIKK